MRLYINEKLFSLHNKYYIKDEQEKDILEISSKVISIGDKTWIKDMNGKELAYIEQQILHLTPHYEVTIENECSFNIKKKLQLIKNDYEISNNYRVEGKFLRHNFSIYNDRNEKVAEIYRKYITIGDRYVIDISDDKNYLIILSIIVAIINDIDRNQRKSVSYSSSSSNNN